MSAVRRVKQRREHHEPHVCWTFAEPQQNTARYAPKYKRETDVRAIGTSPPFRSSTSCFHGRSDLDLAREAAGLGYRPRLHAQLVRRADHAQRISPRLATRIFLNTRSSGSGRRVDPRMKTRKSTRPAGFARPDLNPHSVGMCLPWLFVPTSAPCVDGVVFRDRHAVAIDPKPQIVPGPPPTSFFLQRLGKVIRPARLTLHLAFTCSSFR